MHISEGVSWTINTSSLIKQARHPKESILPNCITGWYGNWDLLLKRHFLPSWMSGEAMSTTGTWHSQGLLSSFPIPCSSSSPPRGLGTAFSLQLSPYWTLTPAELPLSSHCASSTPLHTFLAYTFNFVYKPVYIVHTIPLPVHIPLFTLFLNSHLYISIAQLYARIAHCIVFIVHL